MVNRRHLVVVGVVVFSVSYVLAGGLGVPVSNPPPDGKDMSDAKRIQPVENGSYLWPYTSRRKSTSGRTLAINLVIHGEDERVKQVLTEETRLNWKLTEPGANETTNQTGPSTTAPNQSVGTEAPTAGGVNGVADGTGGKNESDVQTTATATANGTTATPNGTANATANGTTTTPNGTANETANDSRVENTTRYRSIRLGGSGFSWNDAHGSTRYSYIDTEPLGGEERWVDEAYQIHAGEYFGSRYHIRAYTAPRTNWTAVQIHQEYWDWFRLRHTVTDIRDSRTALESNFLEQPYVTDVRREYYGVNGGWNDGWLSEIELAPAMVVALLFGFVSTETRRELRRDGRLAVRWLRGNVRGIVLATVLAGLYLSVRSAGIVLETTVPDIDPRTFLLVLYPMIAAGLPIVAFVFAQPFGATSRFTRLQRIARWLGPPIDALPALAFTVAGLGGAFVLDFGGLGVDSIPVQLALHRIGLAFALGLVAAGATRIDERGGALLAVGLVGWIVGLAMPLFGYL